MADETNGTEGKPAEKPPEKETPPMADPVDFRVAAKNAGYALVPEADLKGLTEAQDLLKHLRSVFPEEARGKEGAFIQSITEKAGQVDALQTRIATVDSLTAENETLKVANTDLTRGKKLSDMWGHISKVQQVRNIRVHDRFIDESKLVDFPLDKHDFSKKEGLDKFTEAVWKGILEPAHKEQTDIIEQVNGGSPAPGKTDGKGGTSKDETDGNSSEQRAPAAFGSQA